MDWNDARVLDSICYDMVLGEYPRSQNRARIAEIANGVPPYTEQEVEDNNIEVNVNDLSMTRLLHDARAQFYNGFMKTGNRFTMTTDMGDRDKRAERSAIVTKAINRVIKKSTPNFEYMRSKFGLLTLHGIAPGVWENEDVWCPLALGVEDVLIPSNTLIGFRNLPFFVLRRSFTGPELQKLTRENKRETGWNMPMVDRILRWIDEQTTQLRSTNWPDVWAPEKIAERVKQDTGYYLGDQAPTIDTFDIYGYVEDEKESGWVRRIILDSWGAPAQSGGGYTISRNASMDKLGKGGRYATDDFLFTNGTRKIPDWKNVISFQFADLSSVAPFRYHSVRSLGFLLYAVCHLQNRMLCKFNEAVFEALMMYFRVKSMDDVQRALKLELVNRGFIDDSISPVPANERFQVNSQLVELGLQQLRGTIAESAASFSQRKDFSEDKTEKTRFQVMAELNAGTAMIGAALAQAYQYQTFEDEEIVRRFMRKNSNDIEVKAARAECLRKGIPEEMLIAEAWEVEHERVVGGGNKSLEMTITQQLMEWRQFFGPEAQQKVLRDGVLAITDDPARSEELVPDQPKISDSVHDTEFAFNALMAGNPITPAPGLHRSEVAATMIRQMAMKIHEIMQSGGMATAEQIKGLEMCSKYAESFIEQLAEDKTAKEEVKELKDALSGLDNEIRAFTQRLQQAMQKQAQAAAQNGQGGGTDPKDMAKARAQMMLAQQKIQQMKQSHAEKTAQRSISFQEKIKQEREQHAIDMQKAIEEHKAKLLKEGMSTAHLMQMNRLKSLSEGPNDGGE